jgi:hypothetical protein
MTNRFKIAVLSITLAVAGAGHASAQQPTFQDALLDHLAGRWLLKGTVAGKPTTHDVEAVWVMEHQYLRIHEVSRELNPKGEPAYEATVYVGWDAPNSQYGCVWLDTYGGVAPISLGTAKRVGDTIPFVFRDKAGAFHTTFAYHSTDNSWDWKLDNEDKGALLPFARVTLTRVK